MIFRASSGSWSVSASSTASAGPMLFPFFALYITQKFEVGMTEAGMILGMFSIFGLIGGMIGGA